MVFQAGTVDMPGEFKRLEADAAQMAVPKRHRQAAHQSVGAVQLGLQRMHTKVENLALDDQGPGGAE